MHFRGPIAAARRCGYFAGRRADVAGACFRRRVRTDKEQLARASSVGSKQFHNQLRSPDRNGRHQRRRDDSAVLGAATLIVALPICVNEPGNPVGKFVLVYKRTVTDWVTFTDSTPKETDGNVVLGSTQGGHVEHSPVTVVGMALSIVARDRVALGDSSAPRTA